MINHVLDIGSQLLQLAFMMDFALGRRHSRQTVDNCDVSVLLPVWWLAIKDECTLFTVAGHWHPRFGRIPSTGAALNPRIPVFSQKYPDASVTAGCDSPELAVCGDTLEGFSIDHGFEEIAEVGSGLAYRNLGMFAIVGGVAL